MGVAMATQAQDGAVDLSWKPAVGYAATFRMVSNMSMDVGQGQPMDMAVTVVVTSKVTKVEDGKVTVEGGVKDFKMNMNGQDMDGPPGGESPAGQTNTQVFSMDGTLVDPGKEQPMSGGERVRRLSVLYRPTAPVKMGDSWTKEVPADKEKKVPSGKYKYTLEATETVDGTACYKIKYVYSEMEGATPFGAIGTMWIDTANRNLVKMEAEYQNIQYVEMMPPTNAKVSLTKIKS